MKRMVICIALFIAVCNMQAQIVDNRSHLERAKELCSKLTLDEKVRLMEHESPAIDRVGIPQWNWWSEALHGVGRNGRATVFPITMGLASTFDDELVQKCFDVVSTEARAKYNIAVKGRHMKIYECLSFWTPNINIFRDPRWGRGQETYGEDPYLTGRMGMAVVRGLQGEEGHRYLKLYACAKHFAVHSGPEWNRHSFDVQDLPVRDLWETYLPAFKDLVTKAKVREIMCAYQRYDGEPCCGSNRLLQQILRNEWGFEGLVTSDCWAVDDFWKSGRHGFSKTKEDAISHAVLSGTDVECGETFRSLKDAVKAGKITKAKIDESLTRLLKGRYELGDLDDPSLVEWSSIKADTIDCQTHKNIALEAARRTIVLLQNNKNILPLKPETRVLVMGENAVDSTMMWGNYNPIPEHTVTLADALRERIPGIPVLEGCPLVGPAAPVASLLKALEGIDVVVFAGGISPRLEGEEMPVDVPGFRGGDRTSLELPSVQRELLAALHQAGKKVVLVNFSGSAMGLEPETQSCDAILQAWYPGEEGGTAIAEVLLGEVSPSGKLPLTFYRNVEQLPDFEDYNMQGRTYRFFKGDPLFPFGFGLSYTSFEYGSAIVRGRKLIVPVTNAGSVDAAEVVQLYVRRPEDAEGPLKTLRGFRRVFIPAGQTVNVSFNLSDETFEWWSEEDQNMVPLRGMWELLYGGSSEDFQCAYFEL